MLPELNNNIQPEVVSEILNLYKQIDLSCLDVSNIADRDHAIYTILHIETIKEICDNLNITCINPSHDLDKLALYIVTNSKVAHNLHRAIMKHHNHNCLEHDIVVEEIVDWESAQYTKVDKPLAAYEYLMKKYKEIEAFPIFEEELKNLGLWENHNTSRLTEEEFNKKWDTVTDDKLKDYLVKAYNYLGEILKDLGANI